MSSLVKTETGCGLQGRTYMKEIVKTEFTWTIENVHAFKSVQKTPISPKFSIGETKMHGTFHLELQMWQNMDPFINEWYHDLFLVKDQPGAAMINAKVLNTNIKGLQPPNTTFSISEKAKQILFSFSDGSNNEIVVGFEFIVVEPASE